MPKYFNVLQEHHYWKLCAGDTKSIIQLIVVLYIVFFLKKVQLIECTVVNRMYRCTVNIWKKKIYYQSSTEYGVSMTSFNWGFQSLI